MNRNRSRLLGLLAIVAALVGLTATPAHAANLVDGSISALGKTCSWTNGSASADPPSTLTISRASINGHLTCSSGVSATLNNDPTVAFDDTAGTGTADAIDASVTTSGLTCRYRAANAVLQRQGTGRTYSATINGVPKVSGSFFCPGTVDLAATVAFH